MALTGTSAPIVLIGFAEAFAAVEATWSLQRAGMKVVAVARRHQGSTVRHMNGVTVIEITAPEVSISQAIEEFDAAVAAVHADAFLPLDDASLWLSDRVRLGETRLVGPDTAGVDLALDKAAQVDAARRAGLDVAATDVAENIDAVNVERWPVIIKPAEAVRQVGDRLVRPAGQICADAGELAQARPKLSGGPVLCQSFIRGTGEGVFGYCGADGPTAWSAHRRIRMMNPHGSASSACESIDVDPALQAAVARMLREIGWKGLFMAEFLRDEAGTAWFMELNGRAWGSLALARRRGFEYPAWAVQDSLGLARSPEPRADGPHLVARHLGRELGRVAFVLRGPQSRAVEAWPRRAKTVLDLLTVHRRDHLYNWNLRHPTVLLFDTWRTVADLAGSYRKGRA